MLYGLQRLFQIKSELDAWNSSNVSFWPQSISLLAAYGILYTLFEKYLWRWKIFRLLRIVNVPDLRGRWKGTIQSSHKSDGVNLRLDSFLEIKQTFSKIFVYAYYERSQSGSVVANFAKLNDEIYLFYTYDNEPNSLKSGSMQAHKGTVKLQHLPQEKKLIGSYFNSIGNNGEIDLEFKQRRLMRRFKKAAQ